jgi:hypothetical protein
MPSLRNKWRLNLPRDFPLENGFPVRRAVTDIDSLRLVFLWTRHTR